MYRPTVRYADEYKTYIDELFHATTLDRNQLLRCALFSAAFSKEFHQIISHFQKKDVPLPPAKWSLEEWHWWRFQDVRKLDGGMDVNAYDSRKRSNEEDGTVSNVRRGTDPKREESLQQKSIPRKTEGRNGPMVAKQSRDVIRGNGGGITITINSKNKSG